MADIELLPLPDPVDVIFSPDGNGAALLFFADQMYAYARANAEHHTEKLRAEVEWLDNRADHLEARAERLEAALQWYVDNDDTNDGQEGNEYWLAGRDRAIALLRDQEESQ